ncbi:uncharacterized protein LOC132785744 [Drosophila nasuta]|uniref:uncharacterized protein LOC132785744 n=1 Tax=Drosophila nasuta TaxID=42062 RepID=UPI00295EEE62|nr:uncharacterized protein LOC132785744 [Drosophila nasuta]
MASLESVLIAGLLHVIFHFALLVDRLKGLDTPGPRLPTMIICAALMDLIYDCRIVPLGLSRLPNVIKIMCECLVAMLLMEVGILIIWQALEFSIYLIVHTMALNIMSGEFYDKYETLIIGAFTIPVAIAILVLTSKVTHHLQDFYRRYLAPKTNVSLQMENTMNFFERSPQYRRKKIYEALSKYNTPMWQTPFDRTSKRPSLWL